MRCWPESASTHLVFTFVGLWLIDRLGRRTLLTIGSFGYIASLGLCAWALFTFFPALVTAFAPGYVFLLFCGMMVLQLIWVKTMSHACFSAARVARCWPC